MKWDTRFLGLAAHISAWSKDPSSQVGAVISDGNRIVSLGYNGFAAGVEDRRERLDDRDCKLNLTIHAEENAMIFAKRDSAESCRSHFEIGPIQAEVAQCRVLLNQLSRSSPQLNIYIAGEVQGQDRNSDLPVHCSHRRAADIFGSL